MIHIYYIFTNFKKCSEIEHANRIKIEKEIGEERKETERKRRNDELFGTFLMKLFKRQIK